MLVPDPQLFVRRAFQLLRPGGYLMIKAPYIADQTFQVVHAFPRLARMLLGAPYNMQFFNHYTLRMLLQENGFDHLDWLKDRRMRSRHPPAVRRVIKKAVARLIVKSVALLGRSGNLYVMAHKPILDGAQHE